MCVCVKIKIREPKKDILFSYITTNFHFSVSRLVYKFLQNLLTIASRMFSVIAEVRENFCISRQTKKILVPNLLKLNEIKSPFRRFLIKILILYVSLKVLVKNFQFSKLTLLQAFQSKMLIMYD